MVAPSKHRPDGAILRPMGVPVLPVLPDIPGPETPAGHARNALALIIFADARLRELAITDPDVHDLLAGARGRLWNVVNELEATQRPALPPWWWRLRRIADRAGWWRAIIGPKEP